MTEQQKNRAVSVLYKNTAKFAVAFAISASPKGRNLLFGLGDTLSGGCRSLSSARCHRVPPSSLLPRPRLHP